MLTFLPVVTSVIPDPAKDLLPIVSKLAPFSGAFFRFTQPSKALAPIDLTALPKLSLVRLTQPLNNPLGMFSRLAVKLERLVQPLKALAPMVSTPEPRSKLLRFSQPLKALAPIFFTLSPIFAAVRAASPAKAESPILVTL